MKFRTKYPKHKTILTDVDGVLLDYFTPFTDVFDLETINANVNSFEEAFDISIEAVTGMVDMFNNSKEFSKLPPLKDSVEYIHKLKKDGFDIIAITAAGKDTHIKESRIGNLENVFGDIFSDYLFVEPTDSKHIHLSKFKDTGFTWIDDSINHYHTGIKNGLDSILMDSKFNHSVTSLQRYHNWDEIYKHINSRY